MELLIIFLIPIIIVYILNSKIQSTRDNKDIKKTYCNGIGANMYDNGDAFYDGNISNSTYLKIFLIDERGANCEECGSDGKLIVHHILPVSMAGSDDFDNLLLLCHECHLNKHNHKFSETGYNSDRKISKKVLEIQKAIEEEKIMTIRYQKPNFDIIENRTLGSTTTKRDIKPLRYFEKDGKYYIEAYCFLRNENRIFKISRISSYKIKKQLNFYRY